MPGYVSAVQRQDRVLMELEAAGGRRRVLVYEHAAGLMSVSCWAPDVTDPMWPGRILDTTAMAGFPIDSALAGDREAVAAWINQQDWARLPLQ